MWCNYHRCLLSSLYWPGDFPGVLAVAVNDAGELTRPGDVVDVNNFIERVLRVDNGHDSVGDHQFTFTPSPTRPGTVGLEWRGSIALSYAGDDEFRYEFHTKLPELSCRDP